MKKYIFVLCFICLTSLMFSSQSLTFNLMNDAYAYNAENGTDWEQTRYTLTYFENVILPYFKLNLSDTFSFSAGMATVIPFHQEQDQFRHFAYIRSTLHLNNMKLILGSLDNNHDFAPVVQDPLISLVPQIRTMSTTRIPINYETYPFGIFSHGRFEYGIQLKWTMSQNSTNMQNPGELYMNWQLADTTNHRERFDVGLTQRYTMGILPLYVSFHYWHNGGHEHPHPISITENYVTSVGLRNNNFNLLYLYSYFLPDRDSHPENNKAGQAIYISYLFKIFSWQIKCEGFASSAWIDARQQFISIEADPFYRTPLYLGINFNKKFKVAKDVSISLNFVNGTFITDTQSSYSPLMIRYDQSIKIHFNTEIFKRSL